MNLKAKLYLEDRNKVVEGRISDRRAFLKENGIDGTAIQRDTLIRKMRAEIRMVNYRLACIAAQEKLNAEKVQAKAEKSSVEKSGHKTPPTETAKGVSGKKRMKEKKKEAPSVTEAQE